MIVDALCLSLIFSLLAGGRPARLAAVNLRGVPLVLAAFVLQYGGQWLYSNGADWMGRWGSLVYLVSLAGVLAFVWMNRTLSGMWLAGAGVALNVLVIVANGGQMPVSAAALQAVGLEHLTAPLQEGAVFTHALMSEATHLPWLGDLIPLPPPYPRSKVVSIGDIVLAAGICWLVVGLLRPWPLSRRRAAASVTPRP